MPTPHITIEQISAIQPELTNSTVVAECNRCNALIDAYNKAINQPEPALSMEMRIENEASLAWERLYPKEPVDPHAALRAKYARQRDAVPCELGFYLWEGCKDATTPWQNATGHHINFAPDCQFRCKDISCYVSKDGEPAIRMLRTDAQKLQAETKDVCDWFYDNGVKGGNDIFGFDSQFTEYPYSYKRKAKPKVRLTVEGEQPQEVTQAEAQAIWELLKGTHDCYFSVGSASYLKDNDVGFTCTSENKGRYQLRLKPLVKLTIDDEPVKMLTPAQCEAERLARVDTHDVEYRSFTAKWEMKDHIVWTSNKKYFAEYRLILKQPKLIPLDWTQPLLKGCNTSWGKLLEISKYRGHGNFAGAGSAVPFGSLELNTPTDDNWQVYILGETDLSSLKGVEIVLLIVYNSVLGFSECIESYGFQSATPHIIKAYCIKGLAAGYCYNNGGSK